jgi:hypothetical protein
MPTSTLRFAAAARDLADAARAEGWDVPGFRSPPRRVGADRTVRRRGSSGAVVSVRVRDRPWLAVLGDMIEGVVVANGFAGGAADRCRTRLWSVAEPRALLPSSSEAGPAPGASVTPAPGWRNRQTQAA